MKKLFNNYEKTICKKPRTRENTTFQKNSYTYRNKYGLNVQ